MNKFQQELRETIEWLLDYQSLDQVIRLNNIQEADIHWRKLESLISQAGDIEEFNNCHKTLLAIYADRDKYKKALELACKCLTHPDGLVKYENPKVWIDLAEKENE